MMRYTLLGTPEETSTPDAAAAVRDADRSDLVARISGFQKAIGAPIEAVRAAERLGRNDVKVIVTGQQPGLLGGPILVLSKALSAIAWARKLAKETGDPVVPVFWAANEDHDLDEVNRVTVLGADDAPTTLRLPIEPSGLMLSEVDPGGAAEDLLLETEAVLPRSQGTPEVMRGLRAAQASSLGRWFAGILTRWLGREGLVIVEPRLMRGAAAGVLELEKRKPGAIAGALGEGPLEPAEVPFFNIVGGRRVRPEGAADLGDDPEAVSWDVVTRVLAQNLALPVAGHVVGPSELEYCRQIEPAHALLGIPAPPLIRRASLTLVERKVEKGLAGFSAGIEEVMEKGEEALIEDDRPEEFDAALTRLTEALEGALVDVRDQAGKVDDVLLRKAIGAEMQLLRAIDTLRDHGRRALERVTGRDVERRRKVLAHLRPAGTPQERILSPLPFFARHGLTLPSRLLEVVSHHPDGRLAVFLSGER